MIPLILSALGGLILVFFGRSLVWMFIGAGGFFYGIQSAVHLFQIQDTPTLLVIGSLCGLAGAVLSIFFYRAAAAAAGFLAGGAMGLQLWMLWTGGSLELLWPPFIIGGIAGLLFVWTFLDIALIGLSITAGATMVVLCLEFFNVALSVRGILWFVLFFLGAFIQGRNLSGKKSEK